MAQNELPADRFHVGDEVAKLSTARWGRKTEVVRGKVVKRTKTQVTVEFPRSASAGGTYTSRYFADRWRDDDRLAEYGMGTYGDGSTLLMATHPDVTAAEVKARVLARRESIIKALEDGAKDSRRADRMGPADARELAAKLLAYAETEDAYDRQQAATA